MLLRARMLDADAPRCAAIGAIAITQRHDIAADVDQCMADAACAQLAQRMKKCGL